MPLRALVGRTASRHEYYRLGVKKPADGRGSNKPLIHFLALNAVDAEPEGSPD
jgi:hypothetical protein